jgi:hypothetical protein
MKTDSGCVPDYFIHKTALRLDSTLEKTDNKKKINKYALMILRARKVLEKITFFIDNDDNKSFQTQDLSNLK